ncbi:hypothetical protein FQA39_LY07743 [Lamprigera yunnana]|nr:hypothetical protein FQA39_LY07743 [Lamprigera yunnana]
MLLNMVILTYFIGFNSVLDQYFTEKTTVVMNLKGRADIFLKYLKGPIIILNSTEVWYGVKIKVNNFIITYDNLESLKDVIEQMQDNREGWNSRGKFMIIINEKSYEEEVQNVLKLLWKYNIYNSVVAHCRNDCRYYSYDFLKSKCGTALIAEQRSNLQLYENKVYNNLCNLPFVVLWYPTPPYTIDYKRVKNQGFMISALKLVGERNHLNVTFEENFEKYNNEATFQEEGSIHEDFKSGHGDCFASVGGYDFRRCLVLYDCTVPIGDEQIFWVIPKPVKRPFWKSVLISFDLTIWILLGISLLIVSLIIWLMRTRDDQFGSFSHCILLAFRAVLGTSHNALPTSVSLRIVFITFSLCCIVINTAYQGKLFDFLQNPGYERGITSLQAILDSGLPLEFEYGYFALFLYNGPLAEKVLDRFTVSLLSANDTLYSSVINQDHITISRGGEVTVNPHLKTSFLTVNLYYAHVVYYMKQDHFLLDFLNFNLQRITESGFFVKWISDIELEYSKVPLDDGKKGAVPLSIANLQGAFFILIIGTVMLDPDDLTEQQHHNDSLNKKKQSKLRKKQRWQLKRNIKETCTFDLPMFTPLWDYTQEDLNVKETIQWISDKDVGWFPNDIEDIKAWIVRGPPKFTINNETNFCEPSMLEEVLRAKEIFDELDVKELSKSRCRANPFEKIRSAFFMNRAALKMANIDAVTGFIFTNIDRDPRHYKKKEPYYFADVCAGPGGFSEYILWRKKWLFKGFGFTLKCDHDFELHQSHCMSPVTFCAQYGVHGDGDICRIENIQHFAKNVLHESEGLGVHFMMSDGGFSVEGNENIQEILSKQLYVCQCLTALEIVRAHGHFVTKLFDLFTPFSIGLIFLMYKCFEKITILKPNASRPANSERYLICYGLKKCRCTDTIRQYLTLIAEELWHLREIRKDPTIDVNEIVSMSTIKSNEEFCKFLTESNNKIGRRQTVGLVKLGVFCRNPTLVDPRQDELRAECLKYWQIPDKPKIPLPRFTTDDLLKIAVHNTEFMNVPAIVIADTCTLENYVRDANDWIYLLLGCSKRTNICNFYAGVGDGKVYRLQCFKWVKVKKLQLIRGTLLYGELVNERVLEKVGDQVKEATRQSLHVVDALRLGDISLADLTFRERADLIETYCQAVNHESHVDRIRIRTKPVQNITTLHSLLESTNKLTNSTLPILGYNNIREFYTVNSMMLLHINKDLLFQNTFVSRIQVFVDQESGIFDTSTTLNSLEETIGDAK